MTGDGVAVQQPILVEFPVVKKIYDIGMSDDANTNALNAKWGDMWNATTGTHQPTCLELDDTFMNELRSTPGVGGHAKWLKNQLDTKTKKYMASEYRQTLRLVLIRMLDHVLQTPKAVSMDMQDKYPLFRIQQVATTAEFFSNSITPGGLTETKLCLIGEYIYAAAPIGKLPGVGQQGIRMSLKSQDAEIANDWKDVFLDNEDCFIVHMKPGTLCVTPAGYYSVTIGIKESVSTMPTIPKCLQNIPPT
jgi:hypothetical protein